MASAADKSTQFDAKQLAELSALADGSLPAERRPAVRERIASSPELSDLFERERRVVDVLHETRSVDRAPASLRAAVDGMRPSSRVRAQRRVVWGGAFAAGLAAVVLAVVLVLPGGTPGAPSVSAAAALALRGVSAPPPAPDPKRPDAKLRETLGDVYFPNWDRSLGWRAVGQRSDQLGGRVALTVYYGRRGKRVAYTIIDTPALAQPVASVSSIRGVQYRTLRLDGRLVVTWRRDNHTCVLSADGVPASVLRQLAAWHAPRA